MSPISFFGFKCPQCETTVDIGAIAGGDDEPLCPNCGTVMVPNQQATPVAANVVCRKCNTSFGLINSDKCPICQTPFDK